MIQVVDFEKTAFSTPFRGVLPPSGPLIIAEDWQGVLRHAVLEAMSIGELGAKGPPTFWHQGNARAPFALKA
jgi:hypothetical protein